MSIPRKSDKGYQIFALAHFIPFDVENSLLRPGQTVGDIFDDACFTGEHLQVLNNWEAIHECQDERDVERMHKRAEKSRESRAMTRALHGSIETEHETDVGSEGAKWSKVRDIRGEVLTDLMRQCGWIQISRQPQAQGGIHDSSATDEFVYPEPTSSRLKEWALSVKQQEGAKMARRRNTSDVSEQVDPWTPIVPSQ